MDNKDARMFSTSRKGIPLNNVRESKNSNLYFPNVSYVLNTHSGECL